MPNNKTQYLILGTLAGILLAIGIVSYVKLAHREPVGNVQGQLDAIEQATIEVFRRQYLMPIILPANQVPGDVLDWSSWTLVERSKRCFPKLLLPDWKPTQLPDITTTESLNGALSVGLSHMLSVGGTDARSYQLLIQFTQPEIVEVSKGDLQRALGHDCDQLTPVVTEQPWTRQGSPPLIVGRVVRAKKRVILAAASQSDFDLALQGAKRAANNNKAIVSPLDARALLGFGLHGQGGVVVESAESLPVAFAPAFLFGRFTSDRGDDPRVFAAREFQIDDTANKELFDAAVDMRLGELRKTNHTNVPR